MTFTIDVWLLAYGALAGAAGAYLARGRNRLIKAAVIGAVVVFLANLLRGLI